MILQLGKFEAKKTEFDGNFCVIFRADADSKISVIVSGISEFNAYELAEKLNQEVITFRLS